MNVDKIIEDIEALEEIYSMSDIRPLRPHDIVALNQQHDQRLAKNPWFQIWNTYFR